MKPTTEPYEELTRLTSGLLDDHLTVEERARLESLLENDAEARRLYMSMIHQEIELSCLLIAAQPENVTDLVSAAEQVPRPTSHNRRRWFAIAAAAMLLLGAGIVALLNFQFERTHSQPLIDSVADRSSGDAPPGTWSEDFEDGLAREWTGQVTAAGLPAGSKFAIASVRMPYREADYYGIRTEDWGRGIFTVNSNSTLQLTYKLGTPAWVNVFMHTVSADPNGGYEMYHLTQTRFPGRAGEWQTASIPLTQFVRKIRVPPENTLQFAGGPPQAGEVITALVFSAPEQIDLVIDQLGVIPAGSGQEEIRPLGK